MVVLAIAACTGDSSRRAASIDLRGAGATFPYPLYRAWFAEYGAKAGVHINYFSVGSAEGLRLLERGEADFGAVDSPTAPASDAGNDACARLAIPTVVGPIAISYNVPSIPADKALQLDAATLAGIYSGAISTWDAVPIRKLNPTLELPAQKIIVVHRAPGSGTSHAFAEYLRSAPGGLFAKHDTATDVVWPVGVSVEGNEGMAAEIKVTRGAIGYVELAYARQNRLPAAALRPAADGPPTLPSADQTTYPLRTRTWIVIDPRRLDTTTGNALRSFVRWALRDGAAIAHDYEYSPVEPDTIAKYERALDELDLARCSRRP